MALLRSLAILHCPRD